MTFVFAVSATVTLITDFGNKADFQNPRWLARWLKAAFLNGLSFVSRTVRSNPQSLPARVAALGYGFFLLITMQSYTAALASILVSKSRNYGIRNFNDVIEKNQRVCLLSAIAAQMKVQYVIEKLGTAQIVQIGTILIRASGVPRKIGPLLLGAWWP